MKVQKPGEMMINTPGSLHWGYNDGKNSAFAYNFTTDNWIPYGIDSKVCFCSDDRVNIPIMDILKEYLPKDDRKKWHNFSKPKCFYYERHLKPTEKTHYKYIQTTQAENSLKQNPNFAYEISYKNHSYRLEDARKESAKYRCKKSKCRAVLNMPLNHKTENISIGNHTCLL